MIEKIHLKNIATYDSIDGVEFQDLKDINFIYGANGTGKSTLSRYLTDSQNTQYNDCQIKWTTTIKPQTVVYNETFLEFNFKGKQEIKGIFTLGQEDVERDKQIEDILRKQKVAEDLIEGFDKNLKKYNSEQAEIKEEFKNSCWDEIHKKYQDVFPIIFKGLNSNKEKLMNKLIESKSLTCNSSYEELKDKYKILFEKEYTQRVNLKYLDFSESNKLKTNSIFSKIIIGEQDVPLAPLINLIKGNDWVSQGKAYFEQTKPVCPFCQSTVSEDFEQHLKDFFNEQFEKDVQILNEKTSELNNYYTDILKFLGEVLENITVDRDIFSKKIDSLGAIFQTNLEKLQEKILSPSVIVNFIDENEFINLINECIKKENDIIDAENKLVSDKKNQRTILDNEIWAFLFSQIHQAYKLYDTAKISKNKAIQSIETQLSDNKKYIQQFESDLIRLNATRTSIKPTVDSINNTLSSFGFTNFQLAESSEKIGFYKLIRSDGSSVNDTLSEGEKRFISFLYFYHLLKGGFTQSENIATNLVVVIDDPISSLDSDVLYLVSTLIKDIIRNIKKKSISNRIKQLFILTHNTFFYKEVAHDCQGNDFKYIVLRKRSQITYQTTYSTNPIKTSYEHLWLEYKQNNPSTIRNTMRKILENYFFVFGSMKLDDLPLKFTGEKIAICRALLSWLHDGSHMMDDNLYIDCSDEMIEKNKEVFKEIFLITKHEQHYEMMMQ